MYHIHVLIKDLKNASIFERALVFSAVVALSVAVLVGVIFVFQANHTRELTVSFFDVGQGDAIYIESPGGSDVLIDGGATQDVMRARAQVEPFWDRTIDAIIATHPDADHIGGLVDVLERTHVDMVGVSGVERDTEVFQAFRREMEQERARVEVLERGMRITIDEYVVLTVLAPHGGTNQTDVNEMSIVARLDYGDTSFLFTGDAPRSVERTLLQRYIEIDADVLKVGHHGSDTSTSSEFVSAVSPATAVISVGADNRYGHPTQNVLDTLEENEVHVLRTDTAGTISFTSDGTEIRRARLSLFEQIF